eukprot:37112_1
MGETMVWFVGGTFKVVVYFCCFPLRPYLMLFLFLCLLRELPVSKCNMQKRLKFSQLMTENEESNNCGDNLCQCSSFIRLSKYMKQYNISDAENNIENIDQKQILNDIQHLTDKHKLLHDDNEEEFEIIMNSIGYCDVETCKILESVQTNKQKEYSKFYQTINQIHCHYQHASDKNEISNNVSELISMNTQIDHKQNDNDPKYKYHFGHLFKYGDNDKHIPFGEEYILIAPKYSSLKHELINNAIKSLSMNQFNDQYIKC